MTGFVTWLNLGLPPDFVNAGLLAWVKALAACLSRGPHRRSLCPARHALHSHKTRRTLRMMRALDLAEAIEAGDLTPATVLELALEAIEDREKDIRAFAALDVDRARLQPEPFPVPTGSSACLLPSRTSSTRRICPPNTARRSTGATGLWPTRHRADDGCAQGLRFGKTATTEFAFLNPAPTFNPHNPAHTPGGSSAGSAAGVAAGFLSAGLRHADRRLGDPPGELLRSRSDEAFLPPVADPGCEALRAAALDTLGLFGARVVDVAFGLAAISGRNLRVDGGDFGSPVFGITRQPFAGEGSREANAALDHAIAALQKAGITVRETELAPIFAEAHAIIARSTTTRAQSR